MTNGIRVICSGCLSSSLHHLSVGENEDALYCVRCENCGREGGGARTAAAAVELWNLSESGVARTEGNNPLVESLIGSRRTIQAILGVVPVGLLGEPLEYDGDPVQYVAQAFAVIDAREMELREHMAGCAARTVEELGNEIRALHDANHRLLHQIDTLRQERDALASTNNTIARVEGLVNRLESDLQELRGSRREGTDPLFFGK